MLSVELLPDSSSAPTPSGDAPSPTPEAHGRPAPCDICPLRQQLRDAQWQAAYYKAQHQRATQREQLLEQEAAQLQAEIRDLQHRLFGRKSEAHHTPDQRVPDDARAGYPETSPDGTPSPTDASAPDQPPRRRGQHRGSPGHGRRDYSHLPTTEEVRDLPPEERCRQRCGQPFAPFPGTDDGTVLEVEVKAHRRLVHRKRYRPCCDCGVRPGIVTAPPPPRPIPKSPFGVSIWVGVLLDKYLFHRPTQRLLADWRSHGLDLASGRPIGGLQQLLPLLEPLYEAPIERSPQQAFWHADETRWRVFASVEGKVGYRGYLWLFHAEDVVVFVRAAGRGHDVPEEYFGPVEGGILVGDRYKAYQAIDKVEQGPIVLAFCWAHQRRDFVELARSWPPQQAWASEWLDRIGALYHLNGRRLELREDSEGFEPRDRDLRAAVEAMAAQAEQELADPSLPPARRKVLESLGMPWTGLTVFVEHPEVPRDDIPPSGPSVAAW